MPASIPPAPETRGVAFGASPLTTRIQLICVVLFALLSVKLAQDKKALEARLADSQRNTAAAEARELELSRNVAAKHKELQTAQQEMETVRYRMDAVELQLDGIDQLSRQVRDQLQLPAGQGTWGDGVSLGAPQGGAAGLPNADRVELANRRLSFGLRELTDLLAAAVASHQLPPAPATLPIAKARPAGWPIQGTLTSGFGWRVFRGLPDYHTGVDVAAPYGSPVAATAGGTVVGSGWQPSYGWCVLIQHPGGYHTLFAHLSERNVSNGDIVSAGETIGLVGSSGHSTGPHVHYEIWQDGQLKDPSPFLSPAGGR